MREALFFLFYIFFILSISSVIVDTFFPICVYDYYPINLIGLNLLSLRENSGINAS